MKIYIAHELYGNPINKSQFSFVRICWATTWKRYIQDYLKLFFFLLLKKYINVTGKKHMVTTCGASKCYEDWSFIMQKQTKLWHMQLRWPHCNLTTRFHSSWCLNLIQFWKRAKQFWNQLVNNFFSKNKMTPVNKNYCVRVDLNQLIIQEDL